MIMSIFDFRSLSLLAFLTTIEDEILRKLELGNKILKKVSLAQNPFSKSRKNIIMFFETPRYIKRQNEKMFI
jgi:hypothetical protein